MDDARYMLDFVLMPDIVRKDGWKIVFMLLYEKEEFVCTIFNKVLHDMAGQPAVYTKEQFRVTEHRISEQQRALYIELPPAADSSAICCTAYVITYSERAGGFEAVRFYTIEKSTRGTTCIGAMGSDGSHINYGRAYPTAEENIAAITRC